MAATTNSVTDMRGEALGPDPEPSEGDSSTSHIRSRRGWRRHG